ncbi:MAG: glycine cleavage system protein GcvH [Spirochaetales bacterium]|nr:glycine cleavage system protein GcvH [Spirochaetales bacterium]MCF7939343.1 glycine cleavage system protein GcvH [Spirochaetales bacterium]
MVPGDLKYSKNHEWVRVEGNTATIGITDFAQEQLGEVTFIELPALKCTVSPGNQIATAESSKAAEDIYTPIAGTITEVNEELEDAPEQVNEDCYGSGWICKMELSGNSGVDKLLSPEEYQDLLEKSR